MTKIFSNLLLVSSAFIFSSTPTQAEEKGTKVSSKECSALMWFTDLNSKETFADPSQSPIIRNITVSSATGDACTRTVDAVTKEVSYKFVLSTTTSGEAENTASNMEFEFKSNDRDGYYALKTITYKAKTYIAIPNGAVSHTYQPNGPLNTAYVCNYNSYRAGKLNFLSFGKFTVQINQQIGDTGVALTDFTVLNDCIGFISSETILGIFTMGILLIITMFGSWMLFGIETMDKFESPAMKPLCVPLESAQ